MTTDIIELHNFIVLIDQSNSANTVIQKCGIDREVIGFVFYGSGDVGLEIRHNGQTKYGTNTTGMAISFFSNENVEFEHTIASRTPLQAISIFTIAKNLRMLPPAEQQMFDERLPELVNPRESFVKGPSLFMTLDMQNAVQKIFNTSYTGNTRLLFVKSQVNELLAHFFAQISMKNDRVVPDTDKILRAKEIITNNIAKPPSLTELSMTIGLNSSKLKKNFKELFGVPVFKFLQEERLKKAYDLLSNTDQGVQEIAWYVGYESLSSFSNAFQKRFGVRPTEVKQQFLMNKS
jgi:AraC-like DNA-binding protein